MAIAVKIDEYVELMGVVAYLSGEISYNSTLNKDIDEYFVLYKKHKAVKRIKQLLQKGLNVNALISFAVLLEYKKGSFVLRKKQSYLEKSDEFLALLADFYKVSLFHKFFKQQFSFYKQKVAEYDDELKSLNIEWLKMFFGDFEQDDFTVSISPILNQMVISSKNEIVVAECTGKMLAIIRVFCHIFINPLLYSSDKRQEILQPCAGKMLELSKWAMQKQGFDDWRVLINEYIVRAVANVYMQENKFTKQAIRDDIMDNVGRGFYLMPELVGYLNKYRYCRDKFKTFGEFYFELAKFFTSHIEKEIKRVDDVVSVILEV